MDVQFSRMHPCCRDLLDPPDQRCGVSGSGAISIDRARILRHPAGLDQAGAESLSQVIHEFPAAKGLHSIFASMP